MATDLLLAVFLLIFFEGASLGAEVPAREKKVAHGNPPTRSKCYPSQSAKTLLKDFVELKLPTILDPGHNTTSLSADQTFEIARAVGFDVTLNSYGLLEGLLVRSRERGAVGSHWVPARSLPSFMGSTWGDSVVSQSHYSFHKLLV